MGNGDGCMIAINTNEYYTQYKNIILTCNKDKIIFPFILTQFKIPEMFDFTDKEHKQLQEKNKKNLNATIKQYKSRREIENKIYFENGANAHEKLDEYYDKELLDWIKKYPKYKNIIL